MSRVGKIARIALFALPPLVLIAALAWTTWSRDDAEPANVTVYEGNLPVSIATPSEALRIVSERVGFDPIVPEHLPLPGLRLVGVRSVVHPRLVDAPRSNLIFSSATSEASFIQVAQGTVYWGPDLDDARQVEIGVPGLEVLAIGEEGVATAQYWLRSASVFVYVLVIGPEPITDGEAKPMLVSIARKMQ